MGRTPQNGHGTPAARLLGLLAVLLGLLAMHGLAGTHHAAAAVPVPPAVVHGGATPGAHGHLVESATNAAGPAAHTAGGAEAAVTALPGSACDGGCRPDAAVLCLAVLVTASAAALLAATARRRAGAHSPTRTSTAGPPAPRRPPPTAPDPVKDLCVSRT